MPDKKFSDFPYLDPSEVAADDEILILDKSNTSHELGDAAGTMSRTLPEAVKNTGNVASRFIYTPIDFATPGTDIDKVKDAINAMGTLAMERKVYNFYTIRYVEGDGSTTISSDGGPGFDSIIDFYQLLRNYSSLGSGGTQLQGSGYANLRLASRISTRDTSVADNDLGEQGVTDIEDVVNANGPYVTNPGGFNLFTVDRSGVPHRYLYVGEAVNIGDGEVQTTSSDWLAWPTTSGEDDGEPDTTPQGYENYIFVQKAYATMAALYAAQADQIKGAVMYVADASAHAKLIYGYAYLEYLGTTSGDESDYTIISSQKVESAELMCSDMSTDLSTGTDLAYWYPEKDGTIVAVSSGCFVAPTGAVVTNDINKNGTTILSTKLTIDAGEKTSITAATPAVISVSSFSTGDIFSVDRDTVGSTVKGKGNIVKLFYIYT